MFNFIVLLRALNKIFDFYIDASIHVALGVFSLFYLFLKKHYLPYDENLAYTIFYGTIISYNLVKFLPQKISHNSYSINIFSLMNCFSIVVLGLLLYYILQLPTQTLLLFCVSFLFVIGYAFPLVRKKNLRSLPAAKIYLVAFCWALAIVAIPAFHFELDLSIFIIIEFIEVFILVVALIIPFDIRDVIYDSLQLQTIPQKYGVRKAKFIAITLLTFYIVFEIFNNQHVIYLIVFLPLMIAIKKMPKESIKYYCSFGIESFPVILLLTYLVMVR